MNKKMKWEYGLILVTAFICLTQWAALNAEKMECETGQIFPKEKLLDISLAAQQTYSSCGAASAYMIIKHHLGENKTPEQDSIKVDGGWPQYGEYGLSICAKYKGLTCRELAIEIANGRPVGFSWQWTDLKLDPSGHYMVARGYIIIDDVMYVVVNDPAPVKNGTVKIMTYSDYIAFNPIYIHWYDDYKIMKKETNSDKTCD